MITVTAGQSLRSAILNAPTDETVISVEAGAVFSEVIELPARERSAPLVIQSSRVNELPEGRRVSPADSAKMFKIVPPVNADPQRAIITQAGAHHYTFLGMEVTHDPSKDWHTLISLGDPEQRTLEEIPHSLVFDRCYIHGHKDRSSVRGIALNSAKTDILNCYISDIHSTDVDSQAICGWAGPGPYRIENCYLEASAENVMFGGADPRIAGLIPSDIQIRRCHFFKPLSWKIGDPSYAGRPWMVKTLFETKNCRRVLVDGCVFENCWPHAQVGFAILLKSNNQDSTAPWSVTEDLTFSNNLILNCEHGINLMGFEYPPKVSGMTKRIKIENNFWDIKKIWLQIIRSGEEISTEHNTHLGVNGNTANLGDALEGGDVPTKGLIFRNNLGTHTEYGIKGDGTSEGTQAFNRWSTGWVYAGNVLAGPRISPEGKPSEWQEGYPADNFYPASLSEVGFVDLTGKNYRLASSSPYKGKGTDGKDPGVDWDALEAAQKGTVSEPVPAPTPTVPEPAPILPPSPDGTKDTTIVDNSGGVWTLGADLATLRNGINMGGGKGTIYKWVNSAVYVLGTNNNWYKWTGSGWVSAGSEPGVTQPSVEPVLVPPPPPMPDVRKVAWPTGEAKQNSVLAAQWQERYRLKRHLTGAFVEFEKVI